MNKVAILIYAKLEGAGASMVSSRYSRQSLQAAIFHSLDWKRAA